MKYWIYMNGEVPGSFTPSELAALPGFGMTTLVCPAEGEILEKNWKRSGEFPDIIPHLLEKEKEQAPPPPPPQAEAEQNLDVDKLIDSASTRLFGHVADLMKELETRREERALISSLQGELQDLRRKDLSRISSLEASLKNSEESSNELRVELEKSRNELSGVKRKLEETAKDLDIRNRLVEKVSRDLADKELSLAKSLTVIRRLEDTLSRLRPGQAAPPAGADAAPPPPAPVERAPSSYTLDEPPPAPPILEPPMPDQPAAHGALVDFFKKFISKDSH